MNAAAATSIVNTIAAWRWNSSQNDVGRHSRCSSPATASRSPIGIVITVASLLAFQDVVCISVGLPIGGLFLLLYGLLSFLLGKR